MKKLTQKTKDSYDVRGHETHRSTEAGNPVEKTRPVKSCVVYRYYIASLGFLSLCLTTAQRIGLSIAVVNMSNYTSPMQQNTTSKSCPVVNHSEQDSPKATTGRDFDLDTEMQGFIIAASYIGATLTVCVSGPLTDAIGCKWILFCANVMGTLCMLASPFLTWWHVYGLIAAQFVRSLSEGLITPPVFKLISNWTPDKEKGFFSSFIMMGYAAGSILGGMTSGYLCELLGWQSVFYFIGVVGCLFSIQFGLSFYETPKDHPRISETELKYITEDQKGKQDKKRLPTPWFKMLTSTHTYAYLYGYCGASWSIFYIISVHALYMGPILNFTISENGLLLSLPFILRFVASLLGSSISDWMYRKKIVGVDKLRKGFNFIGCLGFSSSMLGIYFSGCNKLGNVVFLVFALFTNGIGTCGTLIASADMTPNFSATLVGIAGTLCNLISFIIPVMVGYLTKDQTMEGWHTVFLINIAVVMSSAIVFAVFGSAEVQPWNYAVEERDEGTKESVTEGIASKEEGEDLCEKSQPK